MTCERYRAPASARCRRRQATGGGPMLLQVMAETYRLDLLRSLENRLGMTGFSRIAGVDEAGRGCLAGPVVVAAVIVDPDSGVPGVDDSKNLSASRREMLAPCIRAAARAVSVVAIGPARIDRINILEATRLGMMRALDQLRLQPDFVLLDAVFLPELQTPSLPLVRGDCISYAIACASILAKVERDRIMTDLDLLYPQYGFARHKGYGAREHRAALREFGPTPAHRLSFRSVVPRRSEPWH